MNREVLSQILVCNGHSYANDALQGICTAIYPFDPYKILEAPTDQPYSEEVKLHTKNQREMQKLFNMIVSRGKESALNFIKWNWNLHSQSPWVEDGRLLTTLTKQDLFRLIKGVELTQIRLESLFVKPLGTNKWVPNPDIADMSVEELWQLYCNLNKD